MKKFLIILFLFPVIFFAQEKKPVTVEDLWNMKRIGSYDVSQSGDLIVFSASEYDMEKNGGNSDIYLVDVSGENLKPVKNSEASESAPEFVPNSNEISYRKNGQIWICNTDGTNDRQLTDIYSGVSGYEWSADGKTILFVSSVYPDCETQDCTKGRDEKKEESKIKAKIFTELLYRHWDEWRGEKRSHLFVFDVSNKKYTDLTSGSTFDVPPIALGSSNDYSFSPGGNEVTYTTNTSDFPAASTDNDIYILSLPDNENAKLVHKKISVSQGNDNQPVYSPDGQFIAFCSMNRAGFEADKQNIILYNRGTGKLKNLTESFNLSAGQIIWDKNSTKIFFTAANEIYNSVYSLDIMSGEINLLIEEGVNSSIALDATGETLFFKQQKSTQPYELFSYNLSSKEIKQITNLNGGLLSQLEMNPVETFWYEGAEGTNVQSILVKPPFFDASKKYPMIFLIHGGPQGHWSDDFHYRWNLQLFASKGYVIVAPNPRGSVGYGQKFTDEISKDWGGKVYTDLMNGYDYAIINYDFIDTANTFAAGASYGGYMINWIEGHTNRFNALICHDGVFNTESMYGTTEELWFPEWEFGGTPWQSRKLYEMWSPHRFIQNAETPMLIIHGANDFRVPEEQAFQLFTSLQRLGIESKFLYFPDETHFVLKPQNAKLWWATIFNWFEEHKR